MAELLFYQFCEVLVRVAALRYRQLPGLEKRLHALIHIHLIHQVCLEGAPCPAVRLPRVWLRVWGGWCCKASTCAQGAAACGGWPHKASARGGPLQVLEE